LKCSTAEKVAGVMDTYKESAKKIDTEKMLSDEQKRPKFDVLDKDKNKQLGAILTKEQFEKFVPASERKKE
jgi:hypothetical protein